MKLAYCFAASATLHAALFTIPSFSPENAEEKIIPMRIVVGKREEIHSDSEKSKPQKRVDNAPPLRSRVKPDKTSPHSIEEENIKDYPIAPAPPPAADTASDIPPAVLTGQAGSVSYSPRARSGGLGAPSDAGETLRGGAEESGTGKASSPLTYAQAGYADNPIPEYPERARRQGWEGTVLLSVLVSPEGKPQKIEIKQSSGFEILDRAATAAVMGWRFHPARYGETALESWVRVPIVFRLSDEKN